MHRYCASAESKLVPDKYPTYTFHKMNLPVFHITFRSARLSALLFSLLLLAGCGFKYMYNQLDHMIPGFVSGFVTLDAAQQADVEKRAVQLLRWHRSQQLPQYVKWLENFKQDAAQGLTLQQVRQHLHSLEGFWKNFLAEIADDLAEITLSLTEEQRRELFDKIGADNSDYSAEYVEVDPRIQQQIYLQRLEENFTRWLGSLSKQQHHLIEEAAKRFKPTWDDRLKARLNWQGRVKQILNSKDDRASKINQLKDMVLHPEKYRGPGYSDKLAFNRELFVGLLAETSRSLSKTQRRHLSEKIDDLKSIFSELNKAPKP